MPSLCEQPLLEGAPNFRDLGGAPVAGGRRVRHGLLYRSESFLALTDTDLARLSTLGLNVVCDLRSISERERHGGFLDGPEVVGLIDPTGFDPEQDGLRSMFDREMVRHHHLTVYRRYPRYLAPTIRALVESVLDGGVPAVITCNAGKDRTGVVCAVVLLALGAERSVIEADYLRSDSFYGPDRIVPILTARGGGTPPPDAVEAFRVNAEYLDEAFKAIEELGGVDAYLASELGFDAAHRERLRDLLTEPVKGDRAMRGDSS
jgi:protein-tyrosine phosphatase